MPDHDGNMLEHEQERADAVTEGRCICDDTGSIDPECPVHGHLSDLEARNIAQSLGHAVRLREAVPGDPSAGPYPATTDEVADEVVSWIRDMEPHARGLTDAVTARLKE